MAFGLYGHHIYTLRAVTCVGGGAGEAPIIFDIPRENGGQAKSPGYGPDTVPINMTHYSKN